jgi:glycosyltransferase involved in cell wall biosynthesis
MKVLMIPSSSDMGKEESGIRRVVEAYEKYGKQFGIQYVDKYGEYDLIASHAGATGSRVDVAFLHGLYFTGDYDAPKWEYSANKNIVDGLRFAKQVTVPSRWVAELFARDMRFLPTVVPHGIEPKEWEHNKPCDGFVLWNKNRTLDVCSNHPVRELALRFPEAKFVTTFSPDESLKNVKEIGLMEHSRMKDYVQRSAVYLSTTKETFGIGVLEAMASGVPVLGYAYGGNLDLVQHGVNGYLARPGDINDLAEGLNYCMKFRKILGENGREIVKQFTWEKACEIVYNIYKLAMQTVEPSVSVIIPCYNYGVPLKLGRAITGALEQSYKPAEIIVVDDGSTKGDAQEVVSTFAENDYGVKVRLIRQNNSGVAIARNNGILSSSSKYVCCLDADDSIDPEFLKTCVDALEADRSLGIAYTGLLAISPDGKTKVSEWPGEFNYDEMLKRKNQIPTCCVFKREMFDRLGGYRQRYAPDGAGAEDAEFWLRTGAYGYKAARVSHKPLFLYSFMSGIVSGNKNYREADWLEFHPWTKDLQHPFASVATPKLLSHNVRQYDEPKISVIIPVGASHRDKFFDALDSLEGQKFRKWEAIVVNDSGGKFDDWLYKAYPYVRHFETDGNMGAGYARNLGVKHARSGLLLFLDADDILLPNAMTEMMIAFTQEPAIIYSDHYGKAIIEDVSRMTPSQQVMIVQRNEKTKETIIHNSALDYDCELAQKQPVITGRIYDLYLWCNVTCLVPLAWHNEIGGFDESMPSWEDVDYHWRMARHGKCYTRITAPLMVYRFYTGTRRQTGLDTHPELLQYITEKYKKEKIVVCNCKGQNKIHPTMPATAISQKARSTSMAEDFNFKKIQYMHNNTGEHSVVGASTRQNYGYRKRDDIFLVHVRDIAAQPDLFYIIPDAPQPAVPVEKKETPPPNVIVVKPEPKEELPEPEELSKIDKTTEQVFQTLPGKTYLKAARMSKAGIKTLEDVLRVGEAGLMAIEGIGKTTAKNWYEIAWVTLEGQKTDE